MRFERSEAKCVPLPWFVSAHFTVKTNAALAGALAFNNIQNTINYLDRKITKFLISPPRTITEGASTAQYRNDMTGHQGASPVPAMLKRTHNVTAIEPRIARTTMKAFTRRRRWALFVAGEVRKNIHNIIPNIGTTIINVRIITLPCFRR